MLAQKTARTNHRYDLRAGKSRTFQVCVDGQASYRPRVIRRRAPRHNTGNGVFVACEAYCADYPACVRIVFLMAALTVAAFVAAVVVTLSAPDATPLGRLTPSPVAYLVHASLGTALNRFGLSPVGAATQWVRAASHAGSPAELSAAGQGIAAAWQRSAGDWRVEDVLCNAYGNGA